MPAIRPQLQWMKIGWLPWRKPLVCELSQVRDLRHKLFLYYKWGHKTPVNGFLERIEQIFLPG
jgi:hypothetical protein